MRWRPRGLNPDTVLLRRGQGIGDAEEVKFTDFIAAIGATFLQLIDTPNSYVGQTLKFLRVNVGETAVEFHTPVAADISDFAEAVDDRVAALAVAGANMTITYNDVANTLTFDSTASADSFGGYVVTGVEDGGGPHFISNGEGLPVEAA